MILTFLLIEAIIFGLVIGSFLNVCIFRLPQSQSLGGRSHCQGCEKQISWYENIPIFSFLFLKGKCRHCSMPISRQYPLVEILTAFLSVLTLLKNDYDLPSYFIWFLLFICPLIVITFIDFRHQIIPDIISLPGILIGVLVTLYFGWPFWKMSLLESFWGVLAGGGSLLVIGQLYYLIRKREGMGGGDVKLSAMLGAFLGWRAIIFIFLMSSLLALLYALLSLLFHKNHQKNTGSKEPMVIPYGPFLSTAAVIFYFYGNSLLESYFSLVGLNIR